MVLWLLFGNQWLHTPAHDLMRQGDPAKENKFNIVVGGRAFPWGKEVKNEAQDLYMLVRILGSDCEKADEGWFGPIPSLKEEEAEAVRGGETDHTSHNLLFRSQDEGPGLPMASATLDSFSFLSNIQGIISIVHSGQNI